MLSEVLCPPAGGSHGRTTEAPAQRSKGAKRRPRCRMGPPSAAEDSIEAGLLHLASLQRGSLILREDCHNVVTRASTVGNDCMLYPRASERRECILAMLFWVVAALAVASALAVVWGLYLLVRRWL